VSNVVLFFVIVNSWNRFSVRGNTHVFLSGLTMYGWSESTGDGVISLMRSSFREPNDKSPSSPITGVMARITLFGVGLCDFGLPRFTGMRSIASMARFSRAFSFILALYVRLYSPLASFLAFTAQASQNFAVLNLVEMSHPHAAQIFCSVIGFVLVLQT
jgi:hypothetical protein